MNIPDIGKVFRNDDGSVIKGIRQTKQELSELPYDLQISTSTITCHIDTLFDTEAIGFYFDDFDDILIGKKFGNRIINNLVSITVVKNKKKDNKKDIKKKAKEDNKRNFYNQVSFIFNSAALSKIDTNYLPEKNRNKRLNVKLFSNGAIQMTGCKNPDNIYNSLIILFQKLRKTKAIMDKDFNIVERPYVRDPSKLSEEYVKKLYTQMINTNFNVNFNINRSKLYELLIHNDYDASFDPILHTGGVIVKYKLQKDRMREEELINLGREEEIDPNDDGVSISIYESGSVTIAGCNSPREIKETYYFINKFILTHYMELISSNITEEVITDLLRKINQRKLIC